MPMVRWPVMVPLNDVRGAVSGAAIAVPARARPTVWAMPLTDGTSALGIVERPGERGDDAAAEQLGAAGLVAERLDLASSASGGASGSIEVRCEMRLAPETPSTVAWCILENTAIRSRPSSSTYPSMTHISHSGRDRSSGRPASRPHTCMSSL